MMKRRIGFGLAIIWVFLIAACHDHRSNQHSSALSLASYRGQWVVLNYWASWCEVCLKELPELDRLSQDHGDRVFVIGVNFDGLPQNEVQKIAQKLGIRMSLLSKFDPYPLELPKISVLPTTFLVNPEGKLTHVLHGPQTEKNLLSMLH